MYTCTSRQVPDGLGRIRTYLDSANGFTAVSLSLEQLASVSDIKAIGFKVVPVPGGSGTATLYLDNVRVSADE
ncbi:hypothetical protein GCM10010912_27160 [Paenibacillus albidus]|uniref:Mannanase galactose-binding domain-containing protein n=1 Tax=Paenibacillus albidus TaxID=2041023 RepID=A0A917C9X1_9BACL|nr:hypothetical protein GCM10010912_27160 [Paenibacillus albidus]